ncbi:MAG: glycosyltransferase, partial [Pseudomonadota bacterium]
MSEISKDQSELHAVSQRPEDTPLSIAMTLGSATRRAGGVFYAVRSDAQALVAAGHRVTVFAPHDADAPEDVPSWAPVKAVIATPVGPAALGFAPGIGRELDAGEFDLLHQHGLWQALSLQSQRWRRRADKPVVISP